MSEVLFILFAQSVEPRHLARRDHSVVDADIVENTVEILADAAAISAYPGSSGGKNGSAREVVLHRSGCLHHTVDIELHARGSATAGIGGDDMVPRIGKY